MPETPQAAPTPTPASFTRQVLVVIALVVLALFLWKIAPVLMLFFAGVVLATAIHAGSLVLTRFTRLPPTFAVATVFILLILLFVLGSYLFGKQIAAQFEALWSAILDAWSKVSDYVKGTAWGASMTEHLESASPTQAMGRVAKGTLTVFGGVTDVILVLFLSMYLAVNPETYRNGFLLLIPPRHRERVGEALDASGVALRKWLMGQLGAMLMVGLFTAAGLWFAGVPMAIPLGILSGILDFVPVIGPFAAAIPGILIAFAQGPDVAMSAAIVYITVQFLEGHLVLPLAQKWAVSLPPALGLLSIVAFGLVFGLMGVLFAMPLTVVTVVLVQKLYVARLGATDDSIQRKSSPRRGGTRR